MPSMTSQERAALEARKQANLAQLLFKAARLLNEQALARIRDRTGLAIRPAHTTLFPHINLEHGTRLTEIAARLGVSKQAVGQLVSELEAMGMVERVADPDDGRAKRVCFVRRGGRHGILDGLDVLGEFQTELADAIGDDEIATLHALLAKVVGVLEGPVG
ncbi:MAG: MarR family transcriptional regulator [Myxococcota bacterium]